MARIAIIVVAISFGGLLTVSQGSSAAAQQPAPVLVGQGIPRCDIPKEFGRLVTFVPGSDTGLVGQVTAQSANGNVLAGQAIFEAQNGVIRWVAIVAPANAAGTGKPVIRVMPRNFPVLPIYECALGHVWQRP
jgi:hypothetical protein